VHEIGEIVSECMQLESTAPDTARALAKVLCLAAQQRVTFTERWHLRVFTAPRGRLPAATCDLRKNPA
jgi:hypothetical protein